jgi:hypothetical protein
MSCDCIEDISKRQHVIDYADVVVSDVLETFGIHCEEILEFGIEQIVLRLIHVLACTRHHEREFDDPKVFQEVRDILFKYDRQSPGLLGVIIQEYRAKESKDARH